MILPRFAPALVLLSLLAACGADGEPVAPKADLSVSGTARIGVTTK
ncbi:MAG: argininosuccinate lyase [Pseudorhodobacter sp.]